MFEQVSIEPEIPVSLDNAVLFLHTTLSAEDKEKFSEWSEEKFIALTHHSLGTIIRNLWKLWDGTSVLYRWFKERNIWHADDMSGIILTSYYRSVHDLPIKLGEQIQHYLEYWKNQKDET